MQDEETRIFKALHDKERQRFKVLLYILDSQRRVHYGALLEVFIFILIGVVLGVAINGISTTDGCRICG